MRRTFAERVVRDLIDAGELELSHEVIAVCAGEEDGNLFHRLGFQHVTLTNVDVETGVALHGTAPTGRNWERADVQSLPYAADAFDFAWVSDGLHHCRSPHRAVTEMYRVARKGVIVIESRDSFALRAAVKIGLTGDYEFNARLLDTREHGGVDFGAVPNFVYRWSERDLEKLVRTFDPEHDQAFRYYYGLNLPARLSAIRVARVAARGLTRLVPRQGNTFAMVVLRGRVKPYLNTAATALRSDVTGPKAQRYPNAAARSRVTVR